MSSGELGPTKRPLRHRRQHNRAITTAPRRPRGLRPPRKASADPASKEASEGTFSDRSAAGLLLPPSAFASGSGPSLPERLGTSNTYLSSHAAWSTKRRHGRPISSLRPPQSAALNTVCALLCMEPNGLLHTTASNFCPAMPSIPDSPMRAHNLKLRPSTAADTERLANDKWNVRLMRLSKSSEGLATLWLVGCTTPFLSNADRSNAVCFYATSP